MKTTDGAYANQQQNFKLRINKYQNMCKIYENANLWSKGKKRTQYYEMEVLEVTGPMT